MFVHFNLNNMNKGGAVNGMRNFIPVTSLALAYSKKVDNNRKIRSDPKRFSFFSSKLPLRYDLIRHVHKQASTIKSGIGTRAHP